MPCNIAVVVAGDGVVYPCAFGRSVGWARDHIRERYVITGGSIDCDGVGADEADLIEAGKVYKFVGGSIQAVALSVAPAGESPIAKSRKKRWDSLNNVLDINKKARMRKDGQISLGYSYANWEQVKDFFPIVKGNIAEAPATGLPEPLLSALHQYLSLASLCFGSISEGHEAKRVHFIAPIIIIVCAYFKGNVQILAEETIEGNRVHAHGHFEFVLKRGDKRICIVEAKKDDIQQGKTQSLVGCESLCDVEELGVAYGIATNYLEWLFLKNEADKVTEEMLTVGLEDDRPTADSLKTIANKIIAILDSE